MTIFKRLFVLAMLLLATACGTAHFSGKSGKKADAPNKVQGNKSLDPIPCPLNAALSNGSAAATTDDQTPVQNADASTDNPQQNAGTAALNNASSAATTDDQTPVQNADASSDKPQQNAATETPTQLTGCPTADADQPAQNEF